MADLVDNIEYWRARAEETRVLAESMKDEASRRVMLGIAEDFERMADRAEERVQRRKQSAGKKQ